MFHTSTRCAAATCVLWTTIALGQAEFPWDASGNYQTGPTTTSTTDDQLPIQEQVDAAFSVPPAADVLQAVAIEDSVGGVSQDGGNVIEQIGFRTGTFKTRRPDIGLFADMPRLTARTAVVPPRSLLLEFGGTVGEIEDDLDAVHSSEIDALTGQGLVRYRPGSWPIELRFFGTNRDFEQTNRYPFARTTREFHRWMAGGGLKGNFFFQDGILPEQSALFEIANLEVNDESYTIWDAGWLAHWMLGPDLGLDLSVSGSKVGPASDVNLATSVAVEWFVSEDASSFIEIGGQENFWIAQIGWIGNMTDTIQFNIAGGYRQETVENFWAYGMPADLAGPHVRIGFAVFAR